MQLEAQIPFKQRAVLPICAVVGLHWGIGAELLRGEPELERLPFTRSPESQQVWITASCNSCPSLLWHAHVSSLWVTGRKCLWKAWEASHLPGTYIWGWALWKWFQQEASCSPSQQQITSFVGPVKCGTDEDEAVSIQDAVKYRAQNETLVCAGESTALTGDLPASRAPLSF